jgi:hypothetical protein
LTGETSDSGSSLRLKLERGHLAFLLPLSLDDMLISESGLGGIMRRLALWAAAPLLFVVSFGAIYLSFRSSTPAVRGVVGSGFFLCISLLLLWREFALMLIPREQFGLDPAERAVERIQMAPSPALAAELPSSTAVEAEQADVSRALDPRSGSIVPATYS